MNSIFSKIFSSYLVIVLVLTLLAFLLSVRLIRQHSIKLISESLEENAVIFTPKILEVMEKPGLTSIDSTVKNIGRGISSRITVIAPDGVVLGDTEEDPANMNNHANRPEVIAALAEGRGTSVRFSNTLNEDMIYVAIPLQMNNQKIGVIRFSSWLKDVSLLMRSLKVKLIQSMLIMIFIVLVIAFIFSKSVTRPIKELYQFAINLPKEQFNTRLEIKGDNEINHLGILLNSMADEIQKLFHQLSGERDELDAIINNMNDGLVVIDKNDTVVLANKKVLQSLNDNEFKGKYYWEVIRIDEFREFVNLVKETNTSNQIQIKYSGNYYLINATFLPDAEEIIFLFHDISEIKKLEIAKRDFVSNVSHELRTPLTAIKGFVETLEDEYENPEKYLEIINRNTDRLINMVEDLQILSQLEDKTQQIKQEKVELNKLILSVLKMFDQKALIKNIRLFAESANEDLWVFGDPFKLEQVIINLVDNAIKYTEKGSIIVSAKKMEKSAVFEVEDTGLGIPEKHLERIFERFYVVNKARSRSIGGTGLGLSIVKHILLLHNGTIQVTSRRGKGSKFTVSLPLC